DQNVDRPERGEDVVLHLLHGSRIADVTDDRAGARAELLHLLRHDAEVFGLAILRRRRPVAVVNGDVGAELGKPLRHRSAKAATRSGHNCDFSAELLHPPLTPFFLFPVAAAPLGASFLVPGRGCAAPRLFPRSRSRPLPHRASCYISPSVFMLLALRRIISSSYWISVSPSSCRSQGVR